MQEEHWALRHEAMTAVLAYMRSTASGDFRAVVPRAIHDPGAPHPRPYTLGQTELLVLQSM